jgi:hypothetical protein
VYLPERPDDPSYHLTLNWIADEFTYLRAGGASTIEHIDGRYLSPRTGMSIHERVSLVYADFPADWSRRQERAEVLRYLEELKQFAEAVLWQEETILLVVSPVFHITT